ncbi:MAG: hypothetical protein KDA80_15665 [Planctomycetaceae bacterium]|nr:hypothetical protein [Planctomycetaceae bacterium]
MTFRITPHRQLELTQWHAQRHIGDAAEIQNQISSGVRIARPSDDPQGQRTVLNQKALIARLENQATAIQHARGILNQSNVEILDANSLVVQAKSLALEARQSVDQTDFEAIAQEVDGYLYTLGQIANAQLDGRYLFGGTAHDQPPYSGITDGPTAYQGNEANGDLILPNGDHLAGYLSGDDVFQFPDAQGVARDLFETFRTLRDELRNHTQHSASELADRIDQRIDELNRASDHLLQVVGEQSVSLQQLDRLESRAEDLQLEAQRLLGETESTDFTDAILRLQEEQNLLQYTFATVTHLFETSVLDYL